MQRAVVLGGSFAGLMAARVLSQFADEVVIVEPDLISSEGTERGSPHRRQTHALLAMGHQQLERFFPGITEEMVNGGAQLGRDGAIRFYVDGIRKAPISGAETLSATRPFIEDHVRQRVMGIANVRLQQGTGRGLIFERGRVAGVRLAPDESQSTSEGDLKADLVVDAMGRSSRLSNWLGDAGWETIPADRMKVDLGYATARFTRTGLLPDVYSELDDLVVAHSIPGPATGYQPTIVETAAVAAVEGDTWSAVVAGYAHHKPSNDAEQFLARLRRSVEPVREVADTCKMIGDVEVFNFRESRRRRFTDMSGFPAGLVVMGDAMANVNPIYGQGLTLATLQASSLAAHLKSAASVNQPAWGYFRRAAVVVDVAWELATMADLAQPHVTGPYPRGYKARSWAADRITEASIKDSRVNDVYMRVVQMLEHPKALTHPRTLLRAARVLLQR